MLIWWYNYIQQKRKPRCNRSRKGQNWNKYKWIRKQYRTRQLSLFPSWLWISRKEATWWCKWGDIWRLWLFVIGNEPVNMRGFRNNRQNITTQTRNNGKKKSFWKNRVYWSSFSYTSRRIRQNNNSNKWEFMEKKKRIQILTRNFFHTALEFCRYLKTTLNVWTKLMKG